MKLALQILGIFVLLGLAGMLNIWHNNYKHDKCLDAGGKFVVNTTHANRSVCILEN